MFHLLSASVLLRPRMWGEMKEFPQKRYICKIYIVWSIKKSTYLSTIQINHWISIMSEGGDVMASVESMGGKLPCGQDQAEGGGRVDLSHFVHRTCKHCFYNDRRTVHNVQRQPETYTCATWIQEQSQKNYAREHTTTTATSESFVWGRHFRR